MHLVSASLCLFNQKIASNSKTFRLNEFVAMSISDKEDGKNNETRLREGFVLNASTSLLETPYQEEIIYRRAYAETPFMTSSFDSHTDDDFTMLPSDKFLFTTSPASLQDLDDGSSNVLGLGSVHNSPMDCSLDAENLNDTAVKGVTHSRELVPTEEVPVAVEVAYHRVNPMFESCEPPTIIFCNIYKAMEARDINFSCSPDWTIVAHALVAAEEVCFSVQLHRLAMTSFIRVDFTLRLGDELKFLRLTDSIRKECRSIDRDMMGLPELSFDIMADWSAPEDFFLNL
uniref:Uncharacterized protein n=1 Tax=Peronospora matthiolae TaxID=2874970 RepID=A0AAV1UY79_9STRA